MKEHWDHNFLTFDLGDQSSSCASRKNSLLLLHTIQGETPEMSFETGYHASPYHHSSLPFTNISSK
jgi:hypothetical protein